MKVSIAYDHAGTRFAEVLKPEIAKAGHELVLLNPDVAFDDYPDAAEVLAIAILEGKAERGILVCGSGAGVSIAANKFPGIRAAVCHDTYTAHQGVEHDQMNILCLGERVIGEELARSIVRSFLEAEPSTEERHQRRLRKIDSLENKYFKK
ncbi:RpiB/LacA/LacB family sugar-phosphate isomerase [uncultured Draconibacterium sp.]|uniref:RpiB/LacA/LacB family sugar-phosphate isomerase n=1 Tax=uncultured Draconibacterium sp. TaxID=1573823 RepID=UPI0029C0BA8F|nr:RpiB/LacA/LacB family sugar-phosphate isomerase [uncultured Draconibacterium sp.]